MQKKTVGILAGVAAAHAVLLVGMMVGGGCRQHNILGPHSYNNGPEFNENQPAPAVPTPKPAEVTPPEVPDGSAVVPPPQVVTPPPAPVKPEPQVLPPPAPAKPVKAGTTTYKVKRGDTLSGIAYRHGVRMSDLAACNNLTGKKVNSIYIGQTLTIPEGGVYNPKRAPKRRVVTPKKPTKRPAVKKTPAPTAALPADGVYVVKSGDTLDRIGRRYGVSGSAIAKANNIAVTKVLHIGDKLTIPGKGPAAKPGPAKQTPSAPSGETPVLDVTGLDPNMGLDNAAAPAAPSAESAAAAAEETAAAPAAPAAKPEAPAPAPANVRTESIEVPSDTTVDEYSKQIMVSVEDLRRLNPAIPADGKLKGGTYLVIPSL